MNKKFKVLLTAATLLGSISLASAATITGTVKLNGNPPPERVIPMDPLCTKLHEGGERPKTRFYIVGANNELADVFVYIKEGVDKKYPPPEEPLVIDQVGCEYMPYVAGAQTGQKIVVKNSDPIFHNVHPTPRRDSGNREYNRAHLAGAPDLEFTWDNPEIFLAFKCDVHPWMFSYVSLLEHPYFAVTDEKGQFEIKNLPPGKYVIEAVHRRTHRNGVGISQEITVGEEDQKVDFTIDLK